MTQPPEAYFLTHSRPKYPNSRLPVLVFRSALPAPTTEASASSFISQHEWLPGGVFKHYPTAHFHSVTHECYAVIQGSSRLLLGSTPSDVRSGKHDGVEVRLQIGDVIVLPAGVVHCCLESWDEYTYVGFYPRGSPSYDNNFCNATVEETIMKAAVAKSVPVPEWDPVFGHGGELVKTWRKVMFDLEY